MNERSLWSIWEWGETCAKNRQYLLWNGVAKLSTRQGNLKTVFSQCERVEKSVPPWHKHTSAHSFYREVWMEENECVWRHVCVRVKTANTLHWTSVLPGWAIRSVSPRLPPAQCPGSLHKAGGTSPRKLLLWWREKRVISSTFFLLDHRVQKDISALIAPQTKWPQTQLVTWKTNTLSALQQDSVCHPDKNWGGSIKTYWERGKNMVDLQHFLWITHENLTDLIINLYQLYFWKQYLFHIGGLHCFVWVDTKKYTQQASGDGIVGVSLSRWGAHSGNWSWWCIQVEVTGGCLVMSWRRLTQQLLFCCSTGTWCLYLIRYKHEVDQTFFFSCLHSPSLIITHTPNCIHLLYTWHRIYVNHSL